MAGNGKEEKRHPPIMAPITLLSLFENMMKERWVMMWLRKILIIY